MHRRSDLSISTLLSKYDDICSLMMEIDSLNTVNNSLIQIYYFLNFISSNFRLIDIIEPHDYFSCEVITLHGTVLYR